MVGRFNSKMARWIELHHLGNFEIFEKSEFLNSWKRFQGRIVIFLTEGVQVTHKLLLTNLYQNIKDSSTKSSAQQGEIARHSDPLKLSWSKQNHTRECIYNISFERGLKPTYL